jgi:hypothetical protein
MRRELKKAIDQARDVEGQIRSALRTPMKRNTLWIITESDYDCEVYERFFNDRVVVKPSYDENGNGSCDNVVRIVNSILKSKETKRIVGIRDADYQYFLPERFVYPDNVLHTDERDIEMMMLCSQSVVRDLVNWNPEYSAKINVVKPIACYMGRIRIWHIAGRKTTSMKKFKIAVVWDENASPQKPKPHWKRLLLERYNRLTHEHLNAIMLSSIKNRFGLDDNLQFGKICRGHDFVQLLGLAMVQTDYSSKQIYERIKYSYSKQDFSRTNLAHNIASFANQFGMVVM